MVGRHLLLRFGTEDDSLISDPFDGQRWLHLVGYVNEVVTSLGDKIPRSNGLTVFGGYTEDPAETPLALELAAAHLDAGGSGCIVVIDPVLPHRLAMMDAALRNRAAADVMGLVNHPDADVHIIAGMYASGMRGTHEFRMIPRALRERCDSACLSGVDADQFLKSASLMLAHRQGETARPGRGSARRRCAA